MRVRKLECIVRELTEKNRSSKKMIELLEPQKKAGGRYISAYWEAPGNINIILKEENNGKNF